MITPEQGAVGEPAVRDRRPALANETGHYYDVGGKEMRPSRLADDEGLAGLLWAKSAQWTGLPA